MGIWLILLFFGSCLATLQPFKPISEEHKPAFYCLIEPEERTTIDPELLANVTCTHFVYRLISIDSHDGRPEFDEDWDLMNMVRDGNMRRLLRLKSVHRNAKFLLGVQRRKPFENHPQAEQMAETLRKVAIDKRFDGVLVFFNGHHLEKETSATFMKNLKSKKLMKPTLYLTARRVWQRYSVERTVEMLPYLGHIYIDMTELPSNEDPNLVTQMNPLWKNMTIPFEETIQGTVDQLAEHGVMPNRVVVGLSTGGRMFFMKNAMKAYHGLYADQAGVRLGYQETCRARGAVVFDRETLNEMTLYKKTFITSSKPTREALGKKMEWILNQQFAGFGLASVYLDDPHDKCKEGPLPAHQLAMQILHSTKPSTAAKCNRLCYMNSNNIDVSKFPFESFKSEFCSHIIVDYLELGIAETTKVNANVTNLLEKVRGWRSKLGEKVAPKLILSIGSQTKSTTWGFLLANDLKRKDMVDNVMKALETEKADGVEISWTLEKMNNEFDKKNLNSLIDDINAADKKNRLQVILSASALSTYSNYYDFEHLNKTVNIIALNTHNLHSNNMPFTGHPSPIRATVSMQNKMMSIEEMVKYWVSKGVNPKKLAISMSAAAISMTTIGEVKSTSEAFGQVSIASMFRMNKGEIRTQQEICESIKMESAVEHWAPLAEVPYLMRNGQLVAYENSKSAHIKAIWASMEGVSIAIHDLEADDPFAVCDNKTAFPLLTTLTRGQTCLRCIKQHDFKKCEHPFLVSCSFDLKTTTTVFKTSILPFERCTEMTIEGIKMAPNGSLTVGINETAVLQNITTMGPKMLKCGTILSLQCNFTVSQFSSLMMKNDNKKIYDNIMKYVDKYHFSGIQFDCEHLIEDMAGIKFHGLVDFVRKEFKTKTSKNGCPMTVGMKSSLKSLRRSKKTQLYNKLHSITITSVDKYGMDHHFENGSLDSSETLLSVFKDAGIRPSQIVLEISTYGKMENGTRIKSMSQGQICVALNNKGDYETDYETVTESYKHQSGLYTLPTINTIRYKMGFIQREKLRGVSLSNVNGDDYTGICGRGSFPILKSLYNNQKCRS